MLAVGRRISRDVLALPYVATIEQQVGRAGLSEDTWGPHRSEFHVELKPDADVDQAEAEEALREILSRYPGLQTEVVTFLGDRISESLTGETADIADQAVRRPARYAGYRRPPGDASAWPARRASSTCNSRPQSGTPTLLLQLQPRRTDRQRPESRRTCSTPCRPIMPALTVGQTYAGMRARRMSPCCCPKRSATGRKLLTALMIAGPFGSGAVVTGGANCAHRNALCGGP